MSFIQMVRDNIDGGTLDTMHALYFRGSLESGDLPSKGGLADLIQKGWAETNWDEPKPHRLNALGRTTAKMYYDSKAVRAAALTDRDMFIIDELKAWVAEGSIRWMSSSKPDIREWCPADMPLRLEDIENNPAYVAKHYLGQHPETREIISVRFTIGDRGTDCRAAIIG